MSNQQNKCKDCTFFYDDDRITEYRRDACYFCRRKGAFFSRNYKVGEGTRIDCGDNACKDFVNKNSDDGDRGNRHGL